jgi:glycerophosphoryl diester phosphodiesterase
VHTDHRTLQPESIEKARAKGLRVLVYTVNDPDRAESLLRSGVDAIVTDNLAEFARRFPERFAPDRAEPLALSSVLSQRRG